MIYLELFWSFIKVGFSSFGGLTMVPLVMNEVTSHGWMTPEEVSDIIAIAEMTPGPLGLNCATFAGIRTAGIVGAVVASLGALMPALTVGMLAGAFFVRFRSSRIMENALVGVRPICVGMVFSVVLSLGVSTYFPENKPEFCGVIIGALAFYLLKKRKMDIPKVILISAALGAAAHAVGLIG